MLESLSVVTQQVVILFMLMSLGIVANKKGWLDAKSVKSITNIVLYFVTPCVIVNSFTREASDELIHGLGITVVVAALTMSLSALLAHLVVKDSDDGKERVFRYAVVFSNCGFMGLPLQQALLGDIGVFYGAGYIAVFNIVVWTYGVWLMSGRKEDVNIKKMLLNPGILGTVAGLLVFAFGIKLPAIIGTPISYMAALNTPLPMIIIGYYLGNLKLENFTSDYKQYFSVFLRLIVIPLFAIVGMHLFGLDKTIMVTCAVAASAPTATNTAMFATLYGRNAELGAQMVSVATLISLITMPLIISLAQTI